MTPTRGRIASAETLHRIGLNSAAVTVIAEVFGAWQNDLDPAVAGLQLAIQKSGAEVLSLWAGIDAFTKNPITNRTLFPILSATKGIASMILLHLNYLGYFTWDDLVTRYWPEFGQMGKEGVTIRCAVSHRLGLPAFEPPWERWPDREYMTSLVERAQPAWRPGERYGYHGGAWGVIVDELVRRWTRSETGQVLREALVSVVGTNDCYLGLPSNRYADVARLLYLEHNQRADSEPLGPIGPNSDYNSLTVLNTCQSSGGAVASAEALAGLYALLAHDGHVREHLVWSHRDQAIASQPQTFPSEEPPAARRDLAFTWALGFMVSPSHSVFGSTPISPRTVGHPGASGAIGYAVPEYQLSIGFTINGLGGLHMYDRYRQLGDMLRAAVSPLDER